MSFREALRREDVEAIGKLVIGCGVFSPIEVEIAIEVAAAGLSAGAPSGYHFLLCDGPSGLAGYSAFGPIPATAGSFDLYWIAVARGAQRAGLGGRLLAGSEARAVALAGRRMYVDTSGRADYAPARAFYERCGYRREAVLADFYAPGDAKVIYAKVLPGTPSA